jgi:hypothetical protein
MKHLLLWLCAMLAAGPLHAVPLPGGFDHSGWFKFELVVMVDTRSEVLEGETWPLVPRVNYPSRWRWLREPNQLTALSATHPLAHIVDSPSGHILIHEKSSTPPRWVPPPATLTEGDLALIDELLELGKGTDSGAFKQAREKQAREDSPALPLPSEASNAPLLPFEAITPTPESPSLSVLDPLQLDPLDLDKSDSQPINPVSIPFAHVAASVDLAPITVSASPIPTPDVFVRLALDQLAPGLARYTRNSEDDIIASMSWLQGPDSHNLPILIAPAQSEGYPLAQGFIQLLPNGNQWRLGLNFWVNTSGHYLPEIFEMAPPPPSPSRISIAAPRVTSAAFLSSPEDSLAPAEGSNADSSPSSDFKQSEPTAHTAGHTRALITDASAALPAIPHPPQWPWRHVIHIADTVPLSANRLRYYDHPVIKVLAISRELSWFELFSEGAALRAAASANETARPVAEAEWE